MKRILYLLEAVEGGTWRHVRDLVDALHGKEYECQVALSFVRGESSAVDVRHFLASRNVMLHELRISRGLAIGDIFAFLKLVRVLRQSKIDLIHAHSSKAGFIGRLAAWVVRIPSVYTPHCFPFLMKKNWMVRVYWLAEFLMARLTSAIIVISRQEFAAAMHLKFDQSVIHYIPNGIKSCGLELPQHRDELPLRIGFFGRDVPQKGADTFQRLIKELNSRGVAAQGLIYSSETEKGLKKGLKKCCGCGQHANSESADSNLRWFGVCPQEQVVARMRECDVIVMPSRWEGLPYVLLEALDAGVPVSAYNVGGIGDVVRHRVSAMLAKPENFEELVSNTASLVNCRVRRNLAMQGRADVRLLTLELMVDKIISVYNLNQTSRNQTEPL